MKTTSVRQCSRNSQPRAFARAIALITALCALAFANFATAATLTQTGDWNVSSNWDTELVPTSADTVYINSSRIATIDSDDSGEADVLRVGYGENQNGTLNVDGSLTTVGDMTVGYTPQWMAPSTGTLNLGDTGAIDIGGGLTLGLQHAGGTFNQGANTSVSVGGNLTVSETGGGHTSTYTVPITGTLTLTGVASELRIAYGDGGNGTFT